MPLGILRRARSMATSSLFKHVSGVHVLHTSIEGQSLGLRYFAFSPGAGKVNPPHHCPVLTL